MRRLLAAVPVKVSRGTLIPQAKRRMLAVPAYLCGIPSFAAFSLNATVAPAAPLGFLGLWGSGAQPADSTLNPDDGSIVANAALLRAGANGAVTASTSNPGHLILDINGYFQ